MPNTKRQQESCVPEIEVTQEMLDAGLEAIGDMTAFNTHGEEMTAMYRAMAAKDKSRNDI